MKLYPCNIKNSYGVFCLTKNISFGKKCFDKFIVQKDVINCALKELDEISFDNNDMKKLSELGAKIIFKSGKDAINFANEKNIKIEFNDVGTNSIHAQWSKNENKVIINKKYKDTSKLSEIFAIASAILHELSHAKDDDNLSSIQEEIDCLGMNSLAYNAFSKKYKNVFLGQQSQIIKDGVELYSKLYFSDNKESLIKRISEKYGDLPIRSPNHTESKLAKEVKDYYLKNIKNSI